MKRKFDYFMLAALTIIALVLMAMLDTGCKTPKVSEKELSHKVDSSRTVINTSTQEKDSSRIKAATKLGLVVKLWVDSLGRISPVFLNFDKGEGSQLDVSVVGNNLIIKDTSAMTISLFKQKLQKKDSAIAQLKTWLIMNAKKEVVEVEVTPWWNAWLISLLSALCLISIVIIIILKYKYDRVK